MGETRDLTSTAAAAATCPSPRRGVANGRSSAPDVASSAAETTARLAEAEAGLLRSCAGAAPPAVGGAGTSGCVGIAVAAAATDACVGIAVAAAATDGGTPPGMGWSGREGVPAAAGAGACAEAAPPTSCVGSPVMLQSSAIQSPPDALPDGELAWIPALPHPFRRCCAPNGPWSGWVPSSRLVPEVSACLLPLLWPLVQVLARACCACAEDSGLPYR